MQGIAEQVEARLAAITERVAAAEKEWQDYLPKVQGKVPGSRFTAAVTTLKPARTALPTESVPLMEVPEELPQRYVESARDGVLGLGATFSYVMNEIRIEAGMLRQTLKEAKDFGKIDERALQSLSTACKKAFTKLETRVGTMLCLGSANEAPKASAE